MVGWVPRAGDMGFGVSIFSYAGQVTIGFSTDAHLMPDPERLQPLVLDQVALMRVMAGVASRRRSAKRARGHVAPAAPKPVPATA